MSAPEANPSVLLVDNGTLEPAAIRRLREIAATLSARLQCKVEPVSLQHSDRVSAGDIDGRAAEVIEPALRRRLAAGVTEFVILPFFIGPTRALSEFLPQVLARARTDFPELKVSAAQPLYAPGDDRLAGILEMQIAAILTTEFADGKKPLVALVDHGSPVREVTEVRNRVAVQLAQRLGARVAAVAPCSMERRPAAEYDFNEPLLEKLLATSPWHAEPVVVAHLFLLPGRHAGAGGDIARICAAAEKAHPPLRTVRTALLGDSPQLIEVLAERYRAVHPE